MTPETVSAARRQLAEAQAARQAASDKAQAIRDRIAQSRAALDAITAKRLAGGVSEADTAEFVVVAADMAALQGILETAETAETAKAAIDTGPAKNRLAVAEKQLEEACTREAFDALALRAAALDEALVTCVRALHAEGRKLGKVSLVMSWQPSQPLKAAANGYAP